MESVSVTADAEADADRVWETLADFGGFLDWAYTNAQGTIEVEGDGIGMVRHLDLGRGPMGERLTELDHEHRTLGYDLAHGEPLGMNEYRARVQVEDLGDGRCRLHWTGEFSSADSDQLKSIGETLEAVYANFTRALAAHANRASA
jgi:hypothetical protein